LPAGFGFNFLGSFTSVSVSRTDRFWLTIFDKYRLYLLVFNINDGVHDPY
jgi:hypothetical protein